MDSNHCLSWIQMAHRLYKMPCCRPCWGAFIARNRILSPLLYARAGTLSKDSWYFGCFFLSIQQWQQIPTGVCVFLPVQFSRTDKRINKSQNRIWLAHLEFDVHPWANQLWSGRVLSGASAWALTLWESRAWSQVPNRAILLMWPDKSF